MLGVMHNSFHAFPFLAAVLPTPSFQAMQEALDLHHSFLHFRKFSLGEFPLVIEYVKVPVPHLK